MHSPQGSLLSLSTFDLAFQLAAGKLSNEQKFHILEIIKAREKQEPAEKDADLVREKKTRGPKKSGIRTPGSKAAKIEALLKEGFKPKEIQAMLKTQNIIAYPAEVYRIKKDLEGKKS